MTGSWAGWVLDSASVGASEFGTNWGCATFWSEYFETLGCEIISGGLGGAGISAGGLSVGAAAVASAIMALSSAGVPQRIQKILPAIVTWSSEAQLGHSLSSIINTHN
jgi:hypothetical protein